MDDPGAPPAVLVLHTSYYPLAFLLALCRPKLAINGVPYPWPLRWGEMTIPMVPGRYQVEAWTSYLFYRQMGRNGVTVDIPPGCAVRVTWRAPHFAFNRGPVQVFGPVPLAAQPPAA